MRERRGWTRLELARRAGIGRMVASRIERGVTNPDLDALQRIAVAFGRPLTIDFGGRDPAESPADAGHLAIQDLVLRIGRTAGFTGTFELATRPTEPWRSADVGLASDRARRLIEVECWNTIGDVGAAARSSSRKGAGARGPRHRPMGRGRHGLSRLGRPRDGSQSCAHRALPGGLRQSIPRVVAAMGRRAHAGRGAATRARTHLVRCGRHAPVRLASLRNSRPWAMVPPRRLAVADPVPQSLTTGPAPATASPAPSAYSAKLSLNIRASFLAAAS